MTKKKSTKKNTKKKSTKKKAAPDDNGFEAWLAESRGCRIWDGWSDGAVMEISKTLEHNDRGGNRVTSFRMVERLRDVHGIKVTIVSLTRYCKDVLGRKGWR